MGGGGGEGQMGFYYCQVAVYTKHFPRGWGDTRLDFSPAQTTDKADSRKIYLFLRDKKKSVKSVTSLKLVERMGGTLIFISRGFHLRGLCYAPSNLRKCGSGEEGGGALREQNLEAADRGFNDF